MKPIKRLIVVCAAFVLAVSIGSVTTWGQECSPFQLKIKGEMAWYEPPDLPFTDGLLVVLRQCYTDGQIAEFNFCFSTPLSGDYSGDAIGCGNWAWGMDDTMLFDVGYGGTLWMNPVVYDLPDGAICGMEHSISYWGPQFGILGALQQITGGTGAYEGATGWLTANPKGRVSAPHGIGVMDGWLCTP